MQKKGIFGSVLSLITIPISSIILFYFWFIFGVIFSLPKDSALANTLPSIFIIANIILGVISLIITILSIIIFAKTNSKLKKQCWLIILNTVIHIIYAIELLIVTIAYANLLASILIGLLILALIVSSILYIFELFAMKKTKNAVLENNIPQDMDTQTENKEESNQNDKQI